MTDVVRCGGPSCRRPAVRAFRIPSPLQVSYRCASCPLPNMSDPASDPWFWTEVTVAEALALEVLSS